MSHFAGLTSRIVLGLALIAASPAPAAMSEEEMFFKGTADVNEGSLRFLASPPAQPVHHHHNSITLNPGSLESGWVSLEQCHEHLDPVPSSQIVFSKNRIRDIRVTRAENIGKTWVEANTVQMENVGHDAVVCIAAESRALAQDGVGVYKLSNGPYMRRSLDGFYPMHVSMTVRIEVPGLRFRDISPEPQAGFAVRPGQNDVSYDTWFEGKLRTVIHFVSDGATSKEAATTVSSLPK
jgi:hypothetical protein